MNASLTLISLTALLATCSSVLICPSGWRLEDGSCYIYVTSPAVWEVAEESCGQMAADDVCSFGNGHLVSITSDDENAFVYSLAAYPGPPPTRQHWIGLNDRVLENNFVWSDGSTSSFRNWFPGQPSGDENADCFVQWNLGRGTWGDQICGNTRPYVCEVPAKPMIPCRRLTMISNQPEINHRGGLLYVYAIEAIDGLRPSDEIVLEEKLPSFAVQSDVIEADGISWGCYLKVNLLSAKGSAYGTYSATSNSEDDGYSVDIHTFVKRSSNVLDTRGVYTLTVYRDSSNPMNVEDGKFLTVPFSPRCYKIIWKSDKKRIVNIGPRFKIDSVEHGGIYTIHRRGRKQRGWIVPVEIIVASCPEGQIYISGACTPALSTCRNGGVLRNSEDRCICPPYFAGDDCSFRVRGYEEFTIGYTRNESLRCRDLIGGNPTCKGHLFCLGDLYGCKCAPGWKGNNCERPCRKGRWGADCTLRCPPENSDCNRFFGV